MPQQHRIPRFTLADGTTLRDVPVAVQTWGTLNTRRDNAVIVCHALTGSTDVADWWGDLLGPGRALDPTRDFVVCLNVPGSPYGSVSPQTLNPDTNRPYRTDFPAFTIRDAVSLHRRVLDRLGVRQAALAIGGSMGGMHVLEWAFERTDEGRPFVRALAPVAVGSRHTAWQIGWSEAQRQAIYADPKWRDGEYPPDDPPQRGLATARMMAMVSYRSHPSLSGRFGRTVMEDKEGTPYAVESYLHHQGETFVNRFDARCYVALTKHMDTHDVRRHRDATGDPLSMVEQPTLVVGIGSDVLYPLSEQQDLASRLPNSTLEILSSPHGHDSFLIELDTLNDIVCAWRAQENVPGRTVPV